GIFYISGKEIRQFREHPEKQEPIIIQQIPFSSQSPKPNTINAHLDQYGTLWVEMIPEGFHPLSESEMSQELKNSISGGMRQSSSEEVIVDRGEYLVRGTTEGNIEIIQTQTKEHTLQKVAGEGISLGAGKV